ncbi:MAG TPA: hypothetical protein DEF45_24210, partial [Rhodopirellula sp.]|nr:hypothetical protein [Rhodopirellula sp.]
MQTASYLRRIIFNLNLLCLLWTSDFTGVGAAADVNTTSTMTYSDAEPLEYNGIRIELDNHATERC